MNIPKQLLHFDTVILLLISLKGVFTILSLMHIYLIAIDKNNEPFDNNIMNSRERVGFVFKTLMSVVLVYIFNPQAPKIHLINNHVIFLLFMYGLLLIIENEWGTVLHHIPTNLSFPVVTKIYEKIYKKKSF
jgi:hypothetical protein